MQDPVQANASPPPPGRARFVLGLFVFVSGFVSPALIPLVASSSLSLAIKAALSGLLAFGVPELVMLLAVAILGKAGFEAMKRSVGRFLRRHGPAETVSLARYRLGLVLFSTPLVFGVLEPYLGAHVPGHEEHARVYQVGGDVMFFASFFVLGGAFWDKVRSLFVHRARAVFPTDHDHGDA